jgi:primosomal protein N' (replication factor Y)
MGVVVGCKEDGHLASLHSGKTIRLKPIIETYDLKVPYFDEATMAIAKWMSEYYIYPLGEVLRTMRPLSHKKTSRKVYGFNPETDFTKLKEVESVVAQRFWQRFGDDARVDRKTFKEFAKDLSSVASQKEIEKFSSFVLSNVYCLSQETLARHAVSKLSDSEVKALNSKRQVLTDSQSNAVEAILAEFSVVPQQRRPILLHGVTGAGKTEVYLNLIATILTESDAGSEVHSTPSQILFLVPEISLTPQMTGIFKDRLADRVAVVHSAMDDKLRLEELQKIREGNARVLIGPRSALFADFCSLGMIIIDEEHDASYKQTNNLCYHARDVAVVLSKFKGIPIVLGSATPSLESMKNAKDGRYKLVEMPERILGRPLPPVKLVQSESVHKSAFHLKHNLNASGVSGDRPHVDKEILTALSETHEKHEQAMILVNRRGFSHYLFSLEKKKAVQCPFCSISLTMHLYSV